MPLPCFCLNHHKIDSLELLAHVYSGNQLEEEQGDGEGEDGHSDGHGQPPGASAGQGQGQVDRWQDHEEYGEAGAHLQISQMRWLESGVIKNHLVLFSALKCEAGDFCCGVVVIVTNLGEI